MNLSITPQQIERLENVPLELRSHRQWIVWKLRKLPEPSKNGKEWQKVPVDIVGGDAINAHNRLYWRSFGEARDAAATLGYAGIGFVFTADDPYVMVDLDDCWDDGQWSPEAQSLLERLPGYSEVSVSGNGLHVIVRADPPRNGRKKVPPYEVYWEKRFLAITGNTLPNRHEIADAHSEFELWYPQVAQEPGKRESPRRKTDSLPDSGASGGHLHGIRLAGGEPDRIPPLIDLSPPERAADSVAFRPPLPGAMKDQLEALCGGNMRFQDLYVRGNWESEFQSQSEADLALLSIAARSGISSPDGLDAVLRSSALMRDKWERDDYRDRTISAALQNHDGLVLPDTSATGCRGCDRLQEENRILRKSQEILVSVLQVLANPGLGTTARVAAALTPMFLHCENSGRDKPYPITFTEVARHSGVSTATVGRHLKILETAGLITITKVEVRVPPTPANGWKAGFKTYKYVTPVDGVQEFHDSVATLQLRKGAGGHRANSCCKPKKTVTVSLESEEAAVYGKDPVVTNSASGLVERVKSGRDGRTDHHEIAA